MPHSWSGTPGGYAQVQHLCERIVYVHLRLGCATVPRFKIDGFKIQNYKNVGIWRLPKMI